MADDELAALRAEAEVAISAAISSSEIAREEHELACTFDAATTVAAEVAP